MTTDYLYAAVDESGTITSDEHFEVAACWYVSEKGPRAALSEARVSLQEQLEAMGYIPEGRKEIKGKDLSPDGLDYLFECLRHTVYNGGTVADARLPLDSPVAYSFSGTDTDLARSVLDSNSRNTSVEESIRTMLLLSALNPLLYHGQFQNVDRDRVRVLLDASVWETAKERIENTEKVSDRQIEFEIWDSEKVAGIQFADVAANARFKRHSGETFDGTHKKLESLCLQ